MLAVFSYVYLQRQTCVVGEDVEKLKQRLSLLAYLRQQHWTARPAAHGPEFVGLCPLHSETRPSFYVNARKNLFYCHGCGQGGDLIRFVQLSRHLSFRQSLAYLEQQSAPPVDSAAVLEEAAAFYQEQLDSYPEALRYLKQRGVRDPALIQELRIVFPCCQDGRLVNLYGRSLGAAFAHRSLRGPKGGLYAWERVRQCPAVILVEGLFDYAVLWQAGFRYVTCSLGIHLNACQFRQLCDGSRTVYLSFDVDANGSGQQASQRLAHRLQAQGITTRRVLLSHGHDPNSFFVQGGDARQFQSLLEAAQP